ncbi:hypothetical protein [Acinetobacter sp. ANC 3832]|uniref:hypothetical protein n=1 Tax=Acinetobacter sp. ANC 3832 TaxID=1977874 RepID=UPI000A33585E|nr:hypothetical protein [Acinetobacter sp. ANC 3832]OTG91707.1 hypothetical protein B9T35_14205 [Acinetobacter sp. ANC 3832]
MDMLNQISNRIATLNSGEKWTVSAQELLISRADFQSISVFFSRESEKGQFSIDLPSSLRTWFEQTSFTIIKN